MQAYSQPSVDVRVQVVGALERVAFLASLLAAAAVALSSTHTEELGAGTVMAGVGTLALLAVLYVLLAQRWSAAWLVYSSQIAAVGAYRFYSAARGLSAGTNAMVLVLFCFFDFGISEAMDRMDFRLFARPTLYFSIFMTVVGLIQALAQGRLSDMSTLVVVSIAVFYTLASYVKRWRPLGYAAAVLYNVFLWLAWARIGWTLADHPQFYFIPVGLSAILFAEASRRELGRASANAIRTAGLTAIYLSTAVPLWQFQSFGAWCTLLLLSLAGIFVGIGLRLQSFLWMGLTGFCFDVLYQLGRIGAEDTVAKWAIMLVLGLLLVSFAALNEKKRIALTMRGYYEEVRGWE